ncbi:MAG: hypothetical protein ACI80V_003843 [Rhodothermales bacterium]|jgi:hypothetical protein
MRRFPLLIVILLLAGCDSGSGSNEIPQYYQAQLLLDGLKGLGGGARYEAWALIAAEWQSVAVFNFDQNDRLVDLNGRLVANTFITEVDMEPATEVLVTIEDRRDADLEPSDTQVLRGEVNGSLTTLSFVEAVGDFSGAAASYTIGTPTDLDTGNEAFGVWLGTPGTYTPTMTAPNPGEGWQFELWIELTSGTWSLGKFDDPAGRDIGHPFSDMLELFQVPGEDLLVNPPAGETFPLAVAGHTIFVTLEPNPDDFGVTPYGIRLLEADIAPSAAPGSGFPMTNVGSYPSGTVQFR